MRRVLISDFSTGFLHFFKPVYAHRVPKRAAGLLVAAAPPTTQLEPVYAPNQGKLLLGLQHSPQRHHFEVPSCGHNAARESVLTEISFRQSRSMVTHHHGHVSSSGVRVKQAWPTDVLKCVSMNSISWVFCWKAIGIDYWDL